MRAVLFAALTSFCLCSCAASGGNSAAPTDATDAVTALDLAVADSGSGNGSADSAKTDAPPTDAAPSDASKPDALADAAQPDAAQPDAALTDAAADSGVTDAAKPDGSSPDSAADTSADAAAEVKADATAETVSPPDAIGPMNCCQNCAAPNVCVNGKACLAKPAAGTCYTGADCASNETCQGAFVCPCTADCNMADTVGKCVGAQPACTCDGKACGSDQKCLPDKKVCVAAKLNAGQCWTSADCPANATCDGANICPCGAACFAADKPGQCSDTKPPVDPVCKCVNKPCGAGQTCVSSGCADNGMLKAGQCWADSNCPPGGTCQGANICPCGAMCLVADKPGTCMFAGGWAPKCFSIDPMSFGACEMVIGWVFDGKKCSVASGCGCGKLCDQVYKTEGECNIACM